MKISFEVPWKRYGVITELAELHEARGYQFGKTALQKHVYFLQTLFDVDCGYEFSLYTYGPFSAQLLADLDSLQVMHGVRVSYDPATKGYDIKPSTDSAAIKREAEEFLNLSAGAFERVVREFGSMYAKDLELRATIVFAEREAKMRDSEPKEDEIVSVVHNLKPHFDRTTIHTALRELRRKAYVVAH